MGWNDHMDDDNELGNLPPEAFSSWHVDGQFEPDDHWLGIAQRDHQIIAIRAWFLDRYCDPAHNTPYNGREGGYQFIHGGPYDPADVLPQRFSGAVTDDVIQEVVDELHEQLGDEWAPVQVDIPDDYDEDYGVIVETSGQPLARLRDRLAQSRQYWRCRAISVLSCSPAAWYSPRSLPASNHSYGRPSLTGLIMMKQSSSISSRIFRYSAISRSS